MFTFSPFTWIIYRFDECSQYNNNKNEKKWVNRMRLFPVFVNTYIIEHFVLLRKVWATPAMSSFSLLNWTHISTTHPSLLPSLVLCVFTPSSRTKNRPKASTEHNSVAWRAKTWATQIQLCSSQKRKKQRICCNYNTSVHHRKLHCKITLEFPS